MSSHLTNIPEAVRIAAGGDPNVDPTLKQQALEYIQKVKELSEETWQDSLALYLQGAGAAGPSSIGKDGKEKLGMDLRMFCEQVVDIALIHKSERMSAENLRAMYDALVDFVKVEWVEGQCEGNLPFMRNKLAYTLSQLFVNTYPESLTSFLHPFFALLAPPDPSSSKQNFHPPLLAMRLLSEISLEVHDTTIRATRDYTASQRQKDGAIRDGIRSTGDERLAVDGLLGLAQKGIEVIEAGSGDIAKWTDLVCQALKTLASWIPWIDLSITLTPETLSFYYRILRQPIAQLRIASANIIRSLVAKKIKSPSERLQVLKILDVVSVLTPLEEATRGIKDDEEIIEFRAAIGGILQQYGSDLITVIEHAGSDLMPVSDGESLADIQKEAETMMNATLPLLLSFLSDRQTDVPLSVNFFVIDILRLYKKWHVQRPPPTSKPKVLSPSVAVTPLTEERRAFLSSLLDICVRQLAWPDDAEWEPPGGEDPDPDDDMAKFWTLRMYCSNHIEAVSALDKTLHTQIVANIVASTLNALQSGGPSAISWQQAELALHLVYTFGELVKNNSIAAFFELPAEVSSKAGRDRIRRFSINKAHLDSEMSSGRTTPTSEQGNNEVGSDVIPGVYYGGKDKIDYSKFPLTTLGTLLELCSTAGIVNYPHPSVPLMYFRIAVRYVEFWKAREGTIQPMFEAMLDQRGIHHPDEVVRRRCFWEFTRFVRECKTEMDPDMAAPILQGMRDLLVIETTLPEPETPDEDILLKAATTPSYLTDQLHLFEAAGSLVYITRSDAASHMSLLEALAGPLMAAIGDGLQRPTEPIAVLQVHHYLMALGNFAKGFPAVSDRQLESLPYAPAFKQMTEALLEALNVMKTQRIVRDSARFAFSQFVSAIGSTVAELVPRFVSSVVTEFEASELVDFILFLNLLMHRLKNNAFETMDMLLLPLLSRIFAVLRAPITGTDAASIHSRLKDAYLIFFSALMNANLDGVFITDRNKPEFENVLSELLSLANGSSDPGSQRQAIAFFSRSIIAWGSTNAPSVFADSAASELSKAVAAGTAQATNQHVISKEERAARAFPGYETFIYQRLLPLCFEIPANQKFRVNSGINILHELATMLRNAVTARGQEAVDFLVGDLLPKLQCPPNVAEQLVTSLRTQQSRDFRKTFVDFIKMLRGETGKR